MASFTQASFAVAVVFAATVAPAASTIANTSIPITQVVSVDGVEVFSQSAGHGELNQCVPFARSAVNDAAKPAVKVCGTQTKITVYLRNRCESYHSYQMEIGSCNTKDASETCIEKSPATDTWLSTAQSYKIEQCATGTQAL